MKRPAFTLLCLLVLAAACAAPATAPIPAAPVPTEAPLAPTVLPPSPTAEPPATEAPVPTVAPAAEPTAEPTAEATTEATPETAETVVATATPTATTTTTETTAGGGAGACEDCHADLVDILPEDHVAVPPATVDNCLLCHATGGPATALDLFVHQKHFANADFGGDCWSCHELDAGGNFRALGLESAAPVSASPELVDSMLPYYQSWAASEFLDHAHAQNKVTCQQCHATSFPERRADMEECLGCHGSYEVVAEKTAGLEPNPHDSHMLEIRCTLCHHFHEASELYCNQCHKFDLPVK